ncbi:MAG TPA: Crp/Fnr family transcriptional regulator [Gammaproteobacteria bacterium]|nr:Crp/Fnr family transcriptional regulator [Gammaproteobacteria bacterium]
MSKEAQEKIQSLFEKLSAADQDAVTSFAEFLLSRTGPAPVLSEKPPAPAARAEIPEPVHVPRPEDERVVAAIKRLSKTYSMLNKNSMLGATSDLVTQHLMQGREAGDVIDELERIFAEQYRQLKEGGAD